MNGLFRPEAVAAKRRSPLGEVSLAQAPMVRLLAGFALAATALVLTFLAGAEYTRRSRVAGELVPDRGLATLATPEAGTVLQAFAADGDAVRRGDPLLVIATSQGTRAGGDTTAALLARLDERRAALEARSRAGRALLDARAAGAAAQLAGARRELAQIESELALGQQRLGIAEGLRAELAGLAERRFVSRLELAREESAVLERRAAQEALQRLATSARREIREIEGRLRALELERALERAAREGELAELEAERLRVAAAGEVLVAAPVNGTVASVLASPGQAVRPGQPLLTLVPAGARLRAQLLVPSRAIGFVEPGDEVRLRYRAFPAAKFGHHRGTVVSISRHALDAQSVSLLAAGTPAAGSAYRVLVDLERQYVEAYGARRPLKAGMLVEADILGERRRLYEWLLEPLYSVTGRL